MRTRRHVVLTSALLVASVALSACGGSQQGGDASPKEVLAAAKKTLDETSGVHLSLTGSGVPDGTALLEADGDATHAPAFKGEVKVAYSGLKPTVPLIAVDGKVYAQIPLAPGWQTIDPSEYGAPDPAKLMSTDAGFSSLLATTDDLKQGDAIRGGEDNKQILTEYTGTIDAATAKNILSSATGTFQVVYSIADGDELVSMQVTGDFYDKGATTTYTIDFSDYGSTPDISAP